MDWIRLAIGSAIGLAIYTGMFLIIRYRTRNPKDQNFYFTCIKEIEKEEDDYKRPE